MGKRDKADDSNREYDTVGAYEAYIEPADQATPYKRASKIRAAAKKAEANARKERRRRGLPE